MAQANVARPENTTPTPQFTNLPQRREILDLIGGENQVIAEVDFGILAPCKLTCANSQTHRPLP
jgi:hypothetical protein